MAPPFLVLLSTLLFIWLLGKLQWQHSWPLLLLSVYLFFPELDLRAALLIAAVVLIIIARQDLSPWFRAPSRISSFLGLMLPVLLFFCLYVVTIAPDILPADNGEFQLVAANLGIAHPPGFALYTWLGHLITKLPGAGAPALKLNLFSALTSSLTLAVLYLILFHVTSHRLASLTSMIALGTSTTFWSQATTSNIRSLTGLLLCLSLYFGLLYWSACQLPDVHSSRNQRAAPAVARRSPDYYLSLFALALSAGIIHHASLIFIGLILTVFVLAADPALLRTPRRWRRPLLAMTAGALPLLYLPWQGLRAGAGLSIRGASPAMATWPGFLNHVLALGFRGDLFHFLEPALLWERFKVIGNVMTLQFTPWLLIGMGVGLLLMLRGQRRLALLLSGSFVIHALVTATYRAPQTVEYMLPAYIPAVVCLGYAIAYFADAWPWPESVRTAAGHAIVASLLVAAIAQAIERYPSFRYLHQDRSTREYVQGLLDQAPRNGVILADWHWVTPLWYLQEVEGQRTDVDIRFVFPTHEPYADTWARLIRQEYEQGRPVISTHFDESTFDQLPVPEPAGQAFLYHQEPRLELPQAFTSLDLLLGEQIQVSGYALDRDTVPIGAETVLTLAWQPVSTQAEPVSLFAHLVGSDGQIYAQQDPPARSRAEGLSLTQFHLTPRLGATPGDYTIMIGAYAQAPLPDPKGQGRTPIATLGVTAMSQAPHTNQPLNRRLSGLNSNKRLIGYDWDQTLPDGNRLYLHWQTETGFQTEVRELLPSESVPLPETIGPWGIAGRWSLPYDHAAHYVPFAQGIVWTGPLLPAGMELRPDTTLWLRQRFHASWPVTRDVATSVRLIGYDQSGQLWEWWDLDDAFGIPALGGIPTLKWIGGSAVSDVHQMQVDKNAYPGQTVGVSLGLYDTFTGRPLAVLDPRFTRETAWRLSQISAVEH